MTTAATFQIVLILATLLCSLVAGFLFAFATVVMPGIKTLNDREFIRAFQVIDGVIQNNQPLFVAVWAGSVVASLAAAGLGLGQLAGAQRLHLLSVPQVDILGVQITHISINEPLRAARMEFEPGWNRWNLVRTPFAGLASILLMILLFRL